MAVRHTIIQIMELGPDASALVQLVERDDLDRDSPPANVYVPLKNSEKQAVRDIIDRAKGRYQKRIDKGKADKQADPNAPVDLNRPVENEDTP